MILSPSVAKAAPIIAPPAFSVLAALGVDGHFIVTVAAIIVGVGLGAMWRAGMLRAEGKDWDTVKADLFISCLIGGGNSVLAIAIAEVMKSGTLLGMATGVIIGATGLRALPAIRDAVLDAVRSRLNKGGYAPPPWPPGINPSDYQRGEITPGEIDDYKARLDDADKRGGDV